MFKNLFKKKERDTMTLNKDELEKMKGLSKEDQEILKESWEENTDIPKEDDVDLEQEEDEEEDEEVETKPTKKEKKIAKKKEKAEEEAKVEEKPKETKQEEQPKTVAKPVNAWEVALKSLKEEQDKVIENLKKEVSELKKRSPKGYQPTPTPKKNDEADATERKNKYLKNMY